jgi:hypothetical protein
MPGMIEAAIWNLLAHGARGYTIWPRDFCGRNQQPYTGVTYTGEFSMFADHLWDAQYARLGQVDGDVADNARALNSPTVKGVTGAGTGGVPVTTLGKDLDGRLWVLAQADGNTQYPLSNRSAMTGTIRLPAAITPGTVFTVVGEGRTITVNASRELVDTFATTTETPTSTGRALTYGYDHHIYRQA